MQGNTSKNGKAAENYFIEFRLYFTEKRCKSMFIRCMHCNEN